MIPPVRELFHAYHFLRRRHRWPFAPPDEELLEGLVDAHLEALRLADGSGDEVAALFYSCALASPALG